MYTNTLYAIAMNIASMISPSPSQDSIAYKNEFYPDLSPIEARAVDSAFFSKIPPYYLRNITLGQRRMILRDLKQRKKSNY